MTSPEAPVSRGEAAQAISNALVRLLRDYTGRGPTQAYTTITDTHVIVVLRDALLKAERSLVKDGHADAVIDMRRRFQRTMKTALVAAIEENTGREVLAFLSDHHIDPDIAVEIFILKPRGGGDDRDGALGVSRRRRRRTARPPAERARRVVRQEVTVPAGADPPRPHRAPFRVDVHPERDVVRVVPVGELDLATAGLLERQLHELRDAGFDHVVLDMRELTFIDSSGIRVVVAEHRFADTSDHEFSLISGPPVDPARARGLRAAGAAARRHDAEHSRVGPSSLG